MLQLLGSPHQRLCNASLSSCVLPAPPVLAYTSPCILISVALRLAELTVCFPTLLPPSTWKLAYGQHAAVSSAAKTAHNGLLLANCSPSNPSYAVVQQLAAALHSCAMSSCRTLTACAHQQVQAQAAQKNLAAAQAMANRAREETASLQSQLQQSLDRAITQQGEMARLQAEVASLQQRLQAEQVVVTVTACTAHTYGQVCRLLRCCVPSAA